MFDMTEMDIFTDWSRLDGQELRLITAEDHDGREVLTAVDCSNGIIYVLAFKGEE
jgi:hypothetical protein